LKAIPNNIGIISKTKTVLANSKKDKLKCVYLEDVGSYSFVQNTKLKGVRIGLINVAMDVNETDKATFAFDSELIKLEIFPPGHEATKNIPNAKPGLGFKK
jgi:hypothetical protein